MSVLHHSIRWFVVETISATSSWSDSSDKWSDCDSVLCRFNPHPSVPTSFAAIHGQDALECMKEICEHSHGQFTVRGLLSPPLASHCHWTKRFQYCYLNARWLKGSDLVSSIVNLLYSKTLGAAVGAGMTPRHHAYTDIFQSDGTDNASSVSRQRLSKWPRFVLQVSCPHDECDILSEPDKTAVMFRDTPALQNCVVSLVRKMFAEYNPLLLPIFEATVRSSPLCGASGMTRGTEAETVSSSPENDIEGEGEEAEGDANEIGYGVSDDQLYSVQTRGGAQVSSHTSGSFTRDVRRSVPSQCSISFDSLRYDESAADLDSADSISPHSKFFQSAFVTDQRDEKRQGGDRREEFVTPVFERVKSDEKCSKRNTTGSADPSALFKRPRRVSSSAPQSEMGASARRGVSAAEERLDAQLLVSDTGDDHCFNEDPDGYYFQQQQQQQHQFREMDQWSFPSACWSVSDGSAEWVQSQQQLVTEEDPRLSFHPTL
eukprot:gene38317-47303_t